jgi:Zn-dependent M28 family amino/carboxypeptidase
VLASIPKEGYFVRRLVLLTTAMLVGVMAAPPAQALDEVNTRKLRDGVTVGGILAHERVLQRIANQNGGIRASGTPGFDRSAEYVAGQLRSAGYTVTEQEFKFPFFRDLSDPTLSQVSPTPADYATETMTFSASGDVTGTLVPTNDIVVPPTPEPSSTSGCEPADFTPAPSATAVALIQRGTCTFAQKTTNAAAAGYGAVVIFNEGQPGRDELLQGTLGAPFDVPVLGISFADGAALYAATQAGPVTVHVTADTEVDPNRLTKNIIADSPTGDANKVVLVGAHLDSVVAGPGINDNGSGTSTILEIAKQISALNLKPRQKLRFAFWGAEELGTLGSQNYVDTLSDTDFSKIYANLNFDMVGSPNYVRFVYDGDGSDTPVAGPPGSAQIEQVFNSYFASQNLPVEPTAFDGRSDYGPFIEAGIPAGGLFSGAEGIKTPEEAAVFGGTAGVAYDVCYHQACDTINNLNTKALNELGDAAAHATWTLAKSKSGFFEDGSFRAASAAKRVKVSQTVTTGSFAVK